jgi:tetratricopeptide (TPR) repeat protein
MNRKERRVAAKQGLIVPPSPKAREGIEAAWFFLSGARKYAETGQFQEARELAGYARQLFERYPDLADSAYGFANCDFLDGYLYWRFGALVESEASLKKALVAFRDLGAESYAASCQHQLGVTLAAMGALHDAWDHIDDAHRTFVRLGQSIEAARSEVTLAKLAQGEKRTEEAERLLRAAIATFRAASLTQENADALEALARIYIADSRPVEAEPLLREALRMYRSLGARQGVAFCEEQLAAVLRELAQPDEALSLALSAIRGFDAIRYGLDNPMSRNAWARYQHKAQSLAMEIASERGDVHLISEVIEAARSQTIPALDKPFPGDQVRPPPEKKDLGPPPGLSAVDALKLSPPRPVSVAGLSRLAAGDASNAVELTKAAAEIGGSNAWWWGTLQIEGRLWWSLLRPDGIVEAGSVEIERRSPETQAILEWIAALPLGNSAERIAEVVRAGPLSERSTEQVFSDRLGRVLLPSSLREALMSRSEEDEPLSLVVAPCGLLGAISIAALGIGDGRRVIEAAVVRLAPAVALIAALAQEAEGGRRGFGGPGPLHVGVFDPAAGPSLPQAGRLGATAGACVALSGRNATPDKLRDALQTTIVEPGQPGLFLYAGHARRPTFGLSLLCLHRPDGQRPSCPVGDCCGGDPVTIGDLLTPREDGGRGRFSMPGRVLLFGCDTSGASDLGAGGEWMGLAPAFLWAGARNVVATLWPTLDDPETLAFETALVDVLKRDPDPAASLRKLQLEALRMWRAGSGSAGTDGVPQGSPLIWAAYAAIGFFVG